jgi:thiosulfate/3-mercaptopyruvate sulfurtransferase
MIYQTLVSAQALAAHRSDPQWRIIDCRFDLGAPESGAAAYAAGHLPGAVYAHLDRDLSGARGPRDGRHPLPEPAAFAARLGAWGAGPGTQIVAYDDSQGLYAARLWWMARAIGHTAVAVLDGGLPAWRALGLPLDTALANWPAQHHPAPARWPGTVDAGQLGQLLAAGQCIVLDARSPERFSGAKEPIDPVAGHVPGARNFPMARALEPGGTMLAPEALNARLSEVTEGRPAGSLICMCGSGVTACHTLLALAVAGCDGARLYPGSWSEWCRDPQRPVATGAA